MALIKYIKFTFFIVLTIVGDSQQTAEIIHIRDADEHILSESSKFSLEYELRTPEGGKLFVQVEQLDVQEGEYLLIKRGPTFDDEGTGIVYSGKIEKSQDPILIAADVIFIKLHIMSPSLISTKRHFQLKYRLNSGEPLSTTTTERPTTHSPWPSPGPDDRTHLQIFVAGRTDQEYYNASILMDLKSALRDMAIAFCKASMIEVKVPISVNNVLISDLVRCPPNWPESRDCVAVNFALPIVSEEEDGYKLLAMHLTVMWERHHNLLLPYGFRKYEMPDLHLVWWNGILGAMLGMIVICLCALLAMKECCPQLIGQRDAKSDADCLPVVDLEIRESIVSNASQYEGFKEKSSVTFDSKMDKRAQNEYITM